MDRRIQTALRLMAALGAIAAPALFAQMALAQSAQAQVQYQAQYQATMPAGSTLPPPPYASMDRPASYGGHQVYDRYGGGTTHPRVQATASAPFYAGPRLSWSGKTDAAAGPRQPAPYGQAYATAQPSAQAVAHGWTFVPPIGAPPANAPAMNPIAMNAPPTPTSIYDPAPPPAQPNYQPQYQPSPPGSPVQAQAQSSGDGARRYSVHREFGQEPDPIPIPPQFFGATADLTAPETPEPQRRTVGADGKSRNAIQPTDGQ